MWSSICALSLGPTAEMTEVGLADCITVPDDRPLQVTSIKKCNFLALSVPEAAASFFYGKRRKDFLVGHLATIRTRS